MGKIKSIKYVGKEPVYNITVNKWHNYLLHNGVVSKNCDSLRAFCVYWTKAPHEDKAKDNKPRWTKDLIEDWKHASKEIKQLMLKQLGEPRL